MKVNKLYNLVYPTLLITGFFLMVGVARVTPARASVINESNVVYLINLERNKYNLQPLRINKDLEAAALLKSKDMINRDYFEHYAHGLTPWDFIKSYNYDYLYAGENLAMNFNTSEGMVKAWLNSPAHRDNILNPKYQDIGVGVVKGAYTENNKSYTTTMVTSMFGRQKNIFYRALDRLAKIFPF